jgi:hypothetical protein
MLLLLLSLFDFVFVVCFRCLCCVTFVFCVEGEPCYADAVGEYKISGVRDLTTGYDNTQPDNKVRRSNNNNNNNNNQQQQQQQQQII